MLQSFKKNAVKKNFQTNQRVEALSTIITMSVFDYMEIFVWHSSLF